MIRNELAGKSGKVFTHVHCRDSVDQIVQKHLVYMHSTEVTVAEDMKRLPGFTGCLNYAKIPMDIAL